MKDKELKRLSRAELLELLLEQTRQRELLEQRLEEAEKKLADRQLRMEKAGDIAHAVLEVNGVMEAAQAAARQYIENMELLEQQTRRRCDQMIQQAWQEANAIRLKSRPQQKKKQNRVK